MPTTYNEMNPISEADQSLSGFSLHVILPGKTQVACRGGSRAVPNKHPRSPHRHVPQINRRGYPRTRIPWGRFFHQHRYVRSSRQRGYDGCHLPPQSDRPTTPGAQNYDTQYHGQAPQLPRQATGHTSWPKNPHSSQYGLRGGPNR